MDNKTNKRFADSKKVLVFRPSLKLCAITSSMQAANQLLCANSGRDGVNIRLVAAIKGDQFTHKTFHFRALHPDVEVTIDDIGVLSLEEYDYLCGVKRVYPPAKYVIGKRMASYKSKYRRLNFKPSKINKNERQ
ncbi:MAG: hypothetical protein ACRC6V_00495 [Bacteroidales bacterium]